MAAELVHQHHSDLPIRAGFTMLEARHTTAAPCSDMTSVMMIMMMMKEFHRTVRISGESPCGGVSALVRCGGNVYCWVD
jgi:hypothetical protein